MAFQHEVDIIESALDSAIAFIEEITNEVRGGEEVLEQLGYALSELRDIENAEDYDPDDVSSAIRDIEYGLSTLNSMRG